MDSIGLSPVNRLAGRYRILRKLGEGSFAETFLAEDEHLPDSFQCVVKKLKTGAEDEARLRIAKRLFDAEARTLHQLGHHPQIPQLLAHFEEQGEFCLVEEYIEGLSLYQEFEAGQKWSEGYVIHLLRDVLQALKFVHEKQVIHRDIKPSNIIRRRVDDRIFLIDFGAVKQITSQALEGSSTVSPHTVIVGTPGYMPSEQLRGCPRLSSDVYAVGMIAIYALTGLNPALGQLVEDEHTAEILWRSHAAVSEELAVVLEKMIAYDFRQRYSSAAQALDAVNALKLYRQVAPTILRDESLRDESLRNESSHSKTLFESNLFERKVSINDRKDSEDFHTTSGVKLSSDRFELADKTTEHSAEALIEPTSTGQATHVISADKRSEASATAALPARRDLKSLALALGSLGLAAGLTLALVGPNIEPVCKAMGHCTAEVKYRSIYRDAVMAAESTESAALGAKSVRDLQAAHSTLQKSVQQLSKIPITANSHADAERVLPGYRNRLKSLEAKISVEKKAQQDFNQAAVIADKALTQKPASQTAAQLSENKTQLQKALNLVHKIPVQTFISAEIRTKQQSYQSKIEAFDAEIAKKQAAEALAAEQRRQSTAYQPPSSPAATGSGYIAPAPPSTVGTNFQGEAGGSARDVPAPSSSAGHSSGEQPASIKAEPQEPLWGPNAPAQSSKGSGAGGSQPLW
jgi:serine/threonine protein kinase